MYLQYDRKLYLNIQFEFSKVPVVLKEHIITLLYEVMVEYHFDKNTSQHDWHFKRIILIRLFHKPMDTKKQVVQD